MMDYLLILTVIGFLFSVYEVSEDYKKRSLVFKFNFIDSAAGFLLVFLFIALILLINFFEVQDKELVVSIVCDNSGRCYDIFASYALSVVALALALVLIIGFIVKLNSKNLAKKKEFIEDAIDRLNRRNYESLSADLELFHDDLIRNYISQKKNISFKDLLSATKKDTGLIKKLKDTPEKLNFVKNDRLRYSQLVDQFYFEIISNRDFLEFIAMNNLNLMFKLLDNDLSYRKEDVWEVCGKKLISEKNSRLYAELNPAFDGKPVLLNFLFKDTAKCSRYLIWKPVGDYVINYLRDQRKKAHDEENYNEERYDLIKNESPIYTGIRFFDVMVNKALNQNTANHMWLYYQQYFVEKILKNISYEPEAEGEFANMYEYYLYEIFSNYRNWITYVIRNEYTVKYDASGGPNIVQNAITSMTYSLADVQRSKKLRSRFKSYLRELFIDSYFELVTYNKKELGYYASHFKKEIKEAMHKDDFFIDFLEEPVNNPHNRAIWSEGLHYVMNSSDNKKLQDFKAFLKELKKS